MDEVGDTAIIATGAAQASLSPKELRKLEKEEKAMLKKKRTWKVFVDFLLRHVTIVTSKFAAWERDEFEAFKAALDKAQKLDLKDSESAAESYKKLKERAEILQTKRYFGECNRIRKYIDMVARMRGLSLIARDFYKSIKKGKLEPLENIYSHFLYWKGFTASSFDLREVVPNGMERNHPGTKYVIWICLVRTLLNLGQKFLQCASELTEIPLVSGEYYVSFNLTEDQFAVATRLQQTLATHVSKATGIQSAESLRGPGSLNFSGLASGYGKKSHGLAIGSNSKDNPASQALPGETDHLTFVLPEEPPKDKKKKKKKGKGKKKGGKKKKKK